MLVAEENANKMIESRGVAGWPLGLSQVKQRLAILR